MIHPVKTIIKKILICFFSKLPVQKKVVFINFNGRGFGCNPKYIALEMMKKNIDAELIWLMKDIHSPVPDGIHKTRWISLRTFYDLATAKVIVTNVKNKLPFCKRSTQYFIQTWHGSNAYKAVEAETEETLSREYIEESKYNSSITDLFISDGPKTSEWYRKSFWCTCDILESGMPRNDIFQNGTSDQKAEIRANFHLTLKDKIILYAPTFRDDGSMDGYKIDFYGILHTLKECFKGDWYLLLRLHPNVSTHIEIPIGLTNLIKDVSSYPDAQELLFAADILITDYSSVCNDFLMMDKPVFLYTADLEKYDSSDRKLKENYYDLPMKKNKTNQELIDTIKTFQYDAYKSAINTYKKKYFGIADGHASERVVNRIISVLNK